MAWFLKAASMDAPYAQVLIGSMYEDGRGVPQDYVQAHMWLNLAASGYSDKSEEKLREIVIKERDRVAAKMTPAQIAEAQKLAREWKPTSSSPATSATARGIRIVTPRLPRLRI